VVFIRVPGKTQAQFWPRPFWLLQFWPFCANALRPATASDTPAPMSNFEAPRKLRRDLISVIFPDFMSMTVLFPALAFYSL
jgi:hypothetical protein